MHAMLALILGSLSRLPSPLFKEALVLQPEHLNLEWTATLDHLLLIVAPKAPKREIASWTGT